jgi:hypothetical protein
LANADCQLPILFHPHHLGSLALEKLNVARAHRDVNHILVPARKNFMRSRLHHFLSACRAGQEQHSRKQQKSMFHDNGPKIAFYFNTGRVN